MKLHCRQFSRQQSHAERFQLQLPEYIACGYTDLCRGIDELANLVKSQFQMDLFSRALFLFCGRQRDRL